MKKLIPIYAILSLAMAYFMEAYLYSRWDIWNLPIPLIKFTLILYVFMLIYVSVLLCLIDYIQSINKKIKEKEGKDEKTA